MTTFNPKLQAVVSIRNLAHGISNEWNQLKQIGNEIDDLIDNAEEVISSLHKADVMGKWELEKDRYARNVTSLRGIMTKVRDKIRTKDAVLLSETWDDHKQYSSKLENNLEALNRLGQDYLPQDRLSGWKNIWDNVFSQFIVIQDVVDGCSLQLQMIENYAPEEVDELTDTILKHIPSKYSLEEAAQYEKEYMEAYEELKKEASQKKNLWDRFLDILAGGKQQTPAQRVMLQRWVNGEKGDL